MAFGCGAAAYFALLREPQAWVGVAGVAVAAALLLAASRWSPSRAITAPWCCWLAALGGFSMAKLRTEGAKAPVPARSPGPSGWKAG